MLSQVSPLNTKSWVSPLAGASHLKPAQNTGKRNLALDLLLTALIDAFSILVIFLLMSFSSTGDILFINKGMELPKAARLDAIEANPVVKIEEGKIFLDNKEVEGGDGLLMALVDLKKKLMETRVSTGSADIDEANASILNIQADRRETYKTLNQVVLAAAQAGFSDLRFAALAKAGGG